MAPAFAVFDASSLPISEWAVDASRILSHAMSHPTPQRLSALIADVTGDHPRRHLYLACQEGSLAGAMVMRRWSDISAEIEFIAVDPAFRLRGVARQLVFWARDHLGFEELIAETDRESIGFYIRCGFTTESLGELRPGTERFRCRLIS